MVRVAQRCIMASLDHSRAASIALTTDTGEFTTVEAANFLNVSRPFVIKEIESGHLPHRLG